MTSEDRGKTVCPHFNEPLLCADCQVPAVEPEPTYEYIKGQGWQVTPAKLPPYPDVAFHRLKDGKTLWFNRQVPDIGDEYYAVSKHSTIQSAIEHIERQYERDPGLLGGMCANLQTIYDLMKEGYVVYKIWVE